MSQCSLGPGASYLLHLGLWVSAVPTVLAPVGTGTQSGPCLVPGVIRGQVSPPPSADVTATRAHTLVQHTVYKAVSWPEWHFQRYPVKVITLNLTCLKIHAPRHSVTVREQQAERQSRRESQSMFQKRLIHISSHDGLIRKYLQRIPLGHTLWWHPIPNINRGAALKNALPSQPWKLIAEFSTSRSTTVVQICGCPGAVLLLIIYEITSIVISSREKTGSNIPRHVKRTWNSNFNVHKLYILRAICGIIAHTATARFRQGQGKLVTRLVALHRKFANSCLNFY